MAGGRNVHVVFLYVQHDKIVFVTTGHDGSGVQRTLEVFFVYKQRGHKFLGNYVVVTDVLSADKQACLQASVGKHYRKIVLFHKHSQKVFAVFQQFGQFRKTSCGNGGGNVFRLFFQSLFAHCKTVAVGGNRSQSVSVSLEKHAFKHGTAVVGGYGKNNVVYYLFQVYFLNSKVTFVAYLFNFRVIFHVHRGDVTFASRSGNGKSVVFRFQRNFRVGAGNVADVIAKHSSRNKHRTSDNNVGVHDFFYCKVFVGGKKGKFVVFRSNFDAFQHGSDISCRQCLGYLGNCVVQIQTVYNNFHIPLLWCSASLFNDTFLLVVAVSGDVKMCTTLVFPSSVTTF